MRQISVKYEGPCAKCGATLEVGEPAMYEKSMGLFCIGCEPTNTEEIRTFRQAKADRKADRREKWAESAERKSIQYNRESQKMMSVIPMGQPILIGHHSEKRDRNYRQRAWDKMEKAVEFTDKAQYHRDKAENLRNVRVAGDAERRRQAKREHLDTLISKGSMVHDAVFGIGEVIGIYKKSYRIKFTSKVNADEPYIIARDKSYVRPI